MKSSPTYLTLNRHRTYYFRMVIPAVLRHLVNGKREIRRSLKTDSQRLALKRARQHAVHFESIFDRALRMTEQNDYEPSLEDFDLYEELHSDPKSADAGEWSNTSSYSKKPETLLSDDEIQEQQRRRCVAELLTGRYDRPIPSEQETLARQLLELSRSYMPTELRTALPQLRDALALHGSTSTSVSAAEAHKPAPRHDPTMADWTLYQVWQHQLERDRADTSSNGGQANHGGTLEERERRARVMTVLTQHKPVVQLSKHDWQTAYDAARRMKSGATVSISPAPTPLNELLTDDPEQMTGHERVSALIASMKQIQNHARYIDLTSVRVDDLIIKPVQKRENERSRDGTPFSSDDVEAIFSGFIYQGPVPTDRTKAYPFWFWMPLIGYFTGARTNEIAQLDTADIKDVDGHPCFDICADDPKAPEAKRIKTDEARQVPIHPRLIELGFLEFVDSQRRANQKKLFGDGLTYLPPRNNDTDHNKEGWAKSAGKFFNEKPKGYLVTIGVHKPHDGKSIYSFRHTLITNLRHAKRNGALLDETTIKAITGHTPEDMAGRHYDEGATIKQMLGALMLLPIPLAIQQLTSYRADFVDRFADVLTKATASHRRKHPRTV